MDHKDYEVANQHKAIIGGSLNLHNGSYAYLDIMNICKKSIDPRKIDIDHSDQEIKVITK